MSTSSANRTPTPSIVGVILAAVASATVHSGAASLDWSTTLDLAGDSDGGLIVVGDGAGNVFMLGATPLFAGGEDVVIVKLDSDGDELWMQTYTGIGPDTYEFPVDAVIDGQGNLFVACQSSALGEISPEWATLELDGATGAILWERRFSGPGTFGSAVPRDMAMGPGGEIVVAGWAPNDATWTDLAVVKYAPDGTESWSRLFSSPGFAADSGEAVAVGADGSVVVAGQYVVGGVAGTIMAAVRYDAGGNLQWSRTFDASAVPGLEDRVRSVAIDGDGNAYIAGDGIDDFTDNRDFVLLKYAPDGTLLWDRRVVEPTSDIFPIIHFGPEGNVYLSGTSDPNQRLVAFADDGVQLWTTTHVGAISEDGVRDHVAIDAGGNVAVLLRTVFVPGITAFTIIRHDATGAIVDQTTIDPEGVSRFPQGLATDALGNLFATGFWLPTGNRDMLTYKLSTEPAMPGDVDGDGTVGFSDLTRVLLAWGACSGPCLEDLDGNGTVGFADLTALLLGWG